MATNLLHLYEAVKLVDRHVASAYTAIKEGRLPAFNQHGEPIDPATLRTTLVYVQEEDMVSWSANAARRSRNRKAHATRKTQPQLTQTSLFPVQSTKEAAQPSPDDRVAFSFEVNGTRVEVAGAIQNQAFASFVIELLKGNK